MKEKIIYIAGYLTHKSREDLDDEDLDVPSEFLQELSRGLTGLG